MCKKGMSNFKSVIEPSILVHNVKPSTGRMIKDINTESDIYDTKYYYKSCKIGYTSRNTYRKHLKAVHFMALKTIPSHKITLNTIVSELHDSNLHCNVCDCTYSQKSTYVCHCQYACGMAFVKLAIERRKTDGIIDTYCRLCETQLSNKQSNKKYLFTIHKLDWRLIQQKPKNTLPAADDPNFYYYA
ncbi:hypothetical protein HMPREF1544_09587 [Mucor circinelloides 1006PhL]|uniref:C2H2-type domain-containing protein n=1 Tax=Mucor circinelloides f. circinelloides (strain 1006PhL) TaxID=1220926 RepID=S2J0S9_MUCC1|nr:hypothetical protein HMPREF1544_09587 [Mucor circinelloides 1006PhL]